MTGISVRTGSTGWTGFVLGNRFDHRRGLLVRHDRFRLDRFDHLLLDELDRLDRLDRSRAFPQQSIDARRQPRQRRHGIRRRRDLADQRFQKAAASPIAPAIGRDIASEPSKVRLNSFSK